MANGIQLTLMMGPVIAVAGAADASWTRSRAWR